MSHHARQVVHRGRPRGFTLIESALATVIIGTGVLAMIAAQQTFHQHNGWAQRSANAMRLAGEIRELLGEDDSDPAASGRWGIVRNELKDVLKELGKSKEAKRRTVVEAPAEEVEVAPIDIDIQSFEAADPDGRLKDRGDASSPRPP